MTHYGNRNPIPDRPAQEVERAGKRGGRPEADAVDLPLQASPVFLPAGGAQMVADVSLASRQAGWNQPVFPCGPLENVIVAHQGVVEVHANAECRGHVAFPVSPSRIQAANLRSGRPTRPRSN